MRAVHPHRLLKKTRGASLETGSRLCELGDRLHRLSSATLGATPFALPARGPAIRDAAGDAHVKLVVVGAHLSGMSLNHQIVTCGARLIKTTRTAPIYRLYLLPESDPPKPGLLRSADDQGEAIEVEVWAMPVNRYVAAIPAPLGIGAIELADGSVAQGFVCTQTLPAARDISDYGGWRNFVNSQTR